MGSVELNWGIVRRAEDDGKDFLKGQVQIFMQHTLGNASDPNIVPAILIFSIVKV